MNRLFCFSFFILIAISCGHKSSTGYQNKTSYLPQENIEVYLAAESNYQEKISLHDINGNQIDEVTANLKAQPKVDTSSWYEMGYQYSKTFDYSPMRLKTGLYYFETSSPFVIKNPKKSNDVLVIYPSNTVNAYNDKGGRSTYTKPIGVRLSRKRPTDFQRQSVAFFRWMADQDFNVDYLADEDLENYENIEHYKLIIIPGHNEYWTRQGRRNFDRYIIEGGNGLILSGNTMWKQVRYEGDKVICYNQYHTDSLFPDTLRTSNYSLKQLNYPIENSIGLNFVKGGYGIQQDEGWDGLKITNSSILLENTNLNKGDILSVPSEEADGAELIFENDQVKIDTNFINYYRQKLIGYDYGFRIKKTTPSFIVFQKTPASGTIINVGSNTWCLHGFEGKDSELVKQITTNCINALLKGEDVFN